MANSINMVQSKIVDIQTLQPNEYNPNKMPHQEMELLRDCIEQYGFLFPIVTTWDEEITKYRIIDGYHRFETLKRMGAKECLIVDLDIPYHDAVQLTVLMNRIKGMHQVELMSNLVVTLGELGLDNEEISENLGMEEEELIRLKQQLGIAYNYKDRDYSMAWEEEG